MMPIYVTTEVVNLGSTMAPGRLPFFFVALVTGWEPPSTRSLYLCEMPLPDCQPRLSEPLPYALSY